MRKKSGHSNGVSMWIEIIKIEIKDEEIRTLDPLLGKEMSTTELHPQVEHGETRAPHNYALWGSHQSIPLIEAIGYARGALRQGTKCEEEGNKENGTTKDDKDRTIGLIKNRKIKKRSEKLN